MSKRNGYRPSKRDLPPGAHRFTKPDGTRAWAIGGKEYPSLNAWAAWDRLQKKRAELRAAKAKEEKAAKAKAAEPVPDGFGSGVGR